MTDAAMTRDPDTSIKKSCTFEETKTYFVNATGASISADSSIQHIHLYCQKLPGDKYGLLSLRLVTLYFYG